MTRILLMLLLLSNGSCFSPFACAETPPTVYICNDFLGGEIVRLAGPLLVIEKTEPDELATRMFNAEKESGNSTRLRVVVWREELDSLTTQRLRNQGVFIWELPLARDGSSEATEYRHLKLIYEFLSEQFPTYAPEFQPRLFKEFQRLKHRARLRQGMDRYQFAELDPATSPTSPIP